MPAPQFKKIPISSWKDHQAPRRSKAYHPHKKPKNKKTLLKRLTVTFLILGFISVIISAIYVAIVSRNLPNPNQLINREIAQSTTIYDRTGKHVLYQISGQQKRTLVNLNDIPLYVREATISIEDKDFYRHGAFSLWSIFRAAITDVIYHRAAGGSTLTQQFVKNALLTSQKTISRKVKELILAYRLEQKYSKNQILQMYLNEIPYGSNAYGVEAASQTYFGKPVKDDNLAEAAFLAAIVQMPSYYSPYGPHKDLMLKRKDYVLDLMSQQGYISPAERDAAKAKKLQFKVPGANIIAPHFVMYIKSILAQKYGEQMVEQGGLKIYTTLDLYKQQIAEEAVKTVTKNYLKNFNASNAALVAIDPKTGEILAMVGSRNYFDDSIDGQFNVATSPRQPGSSIKPIVYAALFEKGYTPNTLLYDVNTNFSTNPAKPYIPTDYDEKERGPVTIREALAGSLNIPAVKAMYLASLNNVLNLADNLGYTTFSSRKRFGLSFVLGGGEVKLLEHVNAYSAFARDGKVSPITGILKVVDSKDNVLEQYKPTSKQVIDSQTARMINSVLSDNNARAYVFGSNSPLTLGDRPVGAKTGTTNDYRDAWTIGYTPSLVAGVWVGNDNNSKMSKNAEGVVVAAPIWHYFMQKVLGNTPIETFQPPNDYIAGKPILDGQIPPEIVNIDQSSGLLATSSTPPNLIKQEQIPAYHCILYYVNKDDPLGPAPTDPSQDPQFNAWESAVQTWVNKNASSSLATSTSLLPIGYDNLHTPQNKPKVKIILPLTNETITNPYLEVQVEASAMRGINKTEYYLNNNLWQTRWGTPSSFIAPINFLNNGYQTLKVKSCDDVENCSETTTTFNLNIQNNPIKAGQTTIKLNSPSSGSSVNSIDFPLAIDLSVNQPQRVAQIKLILQNKTSGTSTLVDIIKNLNSTNIQTSLMTYPGPGNYSLFAQLNDWSGNIIKSNSSQLIIN